MFKKRVEMLVRLYKNIRQKRKTTRWIILSYVNKTGWTDLSWRTIAVVLNVRERIKTLVISAQRILNEHPLYFGQRSVSVSNGEDFFSPLGKLADRAIYFACVNFFLILNGDKLSQDPLDRFSRSLHQMIGICSNMTDLDLFFDSSWDVAMSTD